MIDHSSILNVKGISLRETHTMLGNVSRTDGNRVLTIAITAKITHSIQSCWLPKLKSEAGRKTFTFWVLRFSANFPAI